MAGWESKNLDRRQQNLMVYIMLSVYLNLVLALDSITDTLAQLTMLVTLIIFYLFEFLADNETII